MRIVLTGGGTGGHLIPLIAVKRQIQKKNPDARFLFMGPTGKMEKQLMEAENIPRKNVLSGKIRRYFSLLNFLDIFKVPLGIVQSLWILLWNMPDAVFSKGGYASVPVVVAAWLYRIPVLIHESDADPGLANSVLAKFSQRVAVSYPQAEKTFPEQQVVLTGNPLREDIGKGEAQKARDLFHFLPDKKTIFIWGGSQGARIINEHVVEVLPDLLRHYQVIHQTGEKNIEDVKHKAGVLGIKAGREGYFAVPFIGEELKDILALSDLVISRAGSNSISEIAANQKPSIVVPIENSANGHQKSNAYAIESIGGCLVLEENNLGENSLLRAIEKILGDENLQKRMGENIKAFYHPDAAERIAEGVVGMVK